MDRYEARKVIDHGWYGWIVYDLQLHHPIFGDKNARITFSMERSARLMASVLNERS